MELRLYQVDAFTREPFKGNPAAVCLLDSALPDALLQAISAEMNLSETAFVRPLDSENWQNARRFSLRWFTPTVEVRLCGHATLATAAVLFRECGVLAETVAFDTLSGTLMAQRVAGGVVEEGIRLDFPMDKPVAAPVPEGVAGALGDVEVLWSGVGPKTKMLLLHLADSEALIRLQPDFVRLGATMEAAGLHGPIVTAAASPPYDFISRFFAPGLGINEDPVTGSAHTVLAPYWSGVLGKSACTAYQASARGGQLWVRLLPSDRVEIIGQAVVVLEGRLRG
ncbi:MAG: PhzF family phenazine biosynthesis isomerase [Anaerolineae bacterium]|nr:PhzF family phenazine biosynthesis isomerase [Anaerolineae bacterium]